MEPNQTNLEQKTILSFEEFSERKPLESLPQLGGIPRYNNFYLLFAEEKTGNIYKKKEFYQRFAKEHPNIESLLKQIVPEVIKKGDISSSLKIIDNELYDVYKIMKSYGASDEELFC